ncbi:type II toxin-antitoxin system antitoxin SocA domain-containing protein [Xylella fastidiosa]|uniref:type II toxin-antitoxin system antitoxin SocA domain-containing protein n=1 Tax=Xylella fastidiosa TaxID=2371 RepID=UPI0034DE74E3
MVFFANSPWANVTKIDKSTAEILDSVWNSCGHFGGIQLSEMTHKEGTPWWQVWNGPKRKETGLMNLTINNDLIQEFYEQKSKPIAMGSSTKNIDQIKSSLTMKHSLSVFNDE